MKLVQEKLDVRDKKRANIFNWRGQFTPELIEYLIDEFADKDDILLDPFSGSGTVLLESARKNLCCYGFEINPSAYAMSKLGTFCNFDFKERNKLINSFENIFSKEVNKLDDVNLFNNDSSYRENYQNLLDFCKVLVPQLNNKEKRILLLNLLFFSEKDKKMKLADSLRKSYTSLKKIIFDLPFSNKNLEAILDDSRNTYKLLKENVDLIITSPPYINVFNYHQNYRAIIESFGFDILKVAHSEFGSNRKNRGNRFKTVIQYSIDMEQAICSFWKSLKVNGKLILVVGRESNVRKTPFFNGKIIKEIIECMGGYSLYSMSERSFNNKFGHTIKEDIIIATKIAQPPNPHQSRSIAQQHLNEALKKAKDDILIDIEDALLSINKIQPSPLFDSTKIINSQ